MEPLHPRVSDEPDPRLSCRERARSSPGRGRWAGLRRILIGAKNGPDVKIFLLAKSSASASPRTDTGSRSQRMASRTAWFFACYVRLVSTHTTPTFPYKLVCSAVILEHFRWRTFRDFYNCLLLLELYYPSLLNHIFSLHLPFWNPPFILEAHFVCPEHLGINKSVTHLLSQRHP